ncbi:helix-turn-helix domain-containing protein [Agrobacterium vitis]|uniref:helix-turn-helix domain-containing protein n=1 Tax=Agrobacterium vitis TaxID=373 RepID=UPI000AD90899|nr:helix-turn-helix transcriptional regulator [Agrobacterium vitis]WEO75023.1 helix-turn-helix transcriptional regulator [Agrobacterium vitis]
MGFPKIPHETDFDVGQKIKARRRAIGMSQETLGKALGITFQQIQKYEKGTNRVGASRLSNIADFLAVPISYFFRDNDENSERSSESMSLPDDEITRFLATSEGQALNKAFAKIKVKIVKRSVVALTKTLAKVNDEPTEVT